VTPEIDRGPGQCAGRSGVRDKQITNPMNENLSCLSNAIADAGHWHWWKALAPDCLQLEFTQVRLYIPPSNPAMAPSGHFALIFREVRKMQLLDFEADRPPDWPDRIARDELRGGELVPETFVLGDTVSALELVARALRVREIAPVPEGSIGGEGLLACAFETRNGVGAYVLAGGLEIQSDAGEVPLAAVPQMQKEWWAYWKRYWQLGGTPRALPRDINCEISFPAGPQGEDS